MLEDLEEFFQKLLDSSDWPPRWHCGKWTEFHGWLYIISDLLIWSAYFTIPLVIIRYLSRKQHIHFIRLYFLFAAFILACGATHFLDAMAFWVPLYRFNALILLLTGILSWTTVFYLVRYLPLAFSMRTSTDLESQVLARTTELSESKQLLQTIIDNSAAIIYAKDLNGKYLLANEMFFNVFRLSKEDVIGKTDDDFLPGVMANVMHDKDRRTTAAAKPLLDEEVFAFADGVRTYIALKSILKHTSGQTYGTFAVYTDITRQKEIEDNLRKSLQEVSDYKFALDESAIVAITNQKGIIKHVNENFCKISQYTKQELLGQDHRIINSGYHPKSMIRELWVTIANGGIWKGELKNKARDGSFYWVDTTIIPFLNEEGKPYQYVAIRADITGRKQAEEELRQINLDLEDRVKLRTAQLESAKKEMEAFAYSVSHDLRAPLRGVVGFASILEEDYGSKLDSEGVRLTSKIKNNALKMGNLIDDLLAFSRTGKHELVITVADTRQMVNGVIEELNPEDASSPIEWIIHPLPSLSGDIHAIRQVWINLISNAIKYSRNSTPARIEIGHFSQDGQMVFFVKDNGVGFDNEYRGKLFQVFQRLHSAEEFEGTGVGLALVEKIVSKHGGRVWASGEQGKGACFFFSLPITRENQEGNLK